MKKLFFDIETTPLLAYTWGLKTDYIPWDRVQKDWVMLCWAAMDADTGQQFHASNNLKRPLDDRQTVTKLHKLVSKYDVLIGHNVDRFDLPRLKSRALYHGLAPMPTINTIDTLKLSRRTFGMTSNSLDALAKYVGLGCKDSVNYETWMGCMRGEKAAWDKMVKYNMRDVTLLEEVYSVLMPWGKSLNMGNRDKGLTACRLCGSLDLVKRGFRFTEARKIQRLQCKACGAWTDGEKS